MSTAETVSRTALAAVARASGGGVAAVLLAARAVHEHRLDGTRETTFGAVRVTVDPSACFTAHAKLAGLALRRARRGGRTVPEPVAPADDRFTALLDRLVARPDVAVGQVDVISAEELDLLRDKVNRTEAVVPESTFTAGFEAGVVARPDAVAVRHGNVELTYAELNRAANRMARLLAEAGAAREEIVAVMLPRGSEMIVAVLAVLKTGAAYLPVDPDYPAARIGFLLADARPRAVVTTQALADRLPADPMPVVVVDNPTTRADVAGRPPTNPDTGPLPGNAAYVIYTSGSTGRPKGVVVTHRGVVNLAVWAEAEFGPATFSRVLGSTSLSFDMSVFEILVPLLLGGSVDVVRNLLSLLDVPDWSGSLINTVPSVYQRVTGTEWVGEHAANYLFCGEPLPAEVVRQVFRNTPSARVFNVYGPTEGTVYATSWQCQPGETGDPAIGSPVTNTQCRVLDAALRPVPRGHTGELYLAGDYLARGYLGRSGLTAHRFVADPAGGPGARMYRTGDLVRWTEAGLDFVGRVDNQVKVRGHRVELGEIEAMLSRREDLSAAVVVAVADEGDHRLHAYLVGADGYDVRTGSVEAALRAELPDPLVPSRFELLDRLPLNANGKIDRRALTARAAEPARRLPEVTPAGSEVRLLCEVFAGVLGRAGVEPDDSFFALGGDSIRSIKVVRRARQAGLVFSPEDLFEHRTPAALAAVTSRRSPDAPETPSTEPLVRLDENERHQLDELCPDRADVLPVTALQEGLLFHESQARNVYVIQVALDLVGRLRVDELRRAAVLVCQRHPNLRAGFVRLRSGRPVQVVQKDCAPPFVELDLTGRAEQEAALDRLVEQDRGANFAIADPPLIRFTLVRLGDDRFRLVVTAHHVLLDGWSVQIFLREFLELYGDPTGLADPVPYRRYLTWLRDGDERASQRAWRDALAGLPEPTLVAPAAPPPTAAWPAQHTYVMPRDRAYEVAAFAGSHGVTVNILLQCAWGLLLAHWLGRSDVVFGVAVSGRSPEVEDVESIVGFLINTVPTRVRTSPGETVAELLRRVQDEHVGMMAHHHVGLTEIQRATGAGELFDTAMVYQNFPVDDQLSTAMKDIEITAATVRAATHYPLTLMATPSAAGTDLTFVYRQDVFTPRFVEGLAARLLRVINLLVEGSLKRVGALDLLDEAEHATLERYRASGIQIAARTIPDMVEAQVDRTPDAPALRITDHRDTTWTYAELDSRANRLARELLGQGVGPEQRVGVLLPRSAELVVAILAVLKAGAAFVPLDSEYPEARLLWMLADARPTVVLTNVVGSYLPAHHTEQLLVLDDPATAERIAAHDPGALTDADRTVPLRPANAAYVIYTSGSTGTPKGVVVPHGGMAGVVHSTAPRQGHGPGARVLQFASPSFDAAVLEIFEALTTGSTLVVAPPDHMRPGPALERLTRAEGITAITVPPSVLAVLTPGAGLPTGIAIRVAGEACPAELAARWTADARVVNGYGPTEATVCASISDELTGAGAPIGRPVANMTIHVLDHTLRPVAPGQVGELYLSGAAVARGYSGQPARTAERFVADPFAGPGVRMYRTGDLGRWNDDGQLEFAGRVDRQVKIRGVRVEPGEVEAAVLRHEMVGGATVRAWTDPSGDTRLVAYVSADPAAAAAGSSGISEQELLDKWASTRDTVYAPQERAYRKTPEHVPFGDSFAEWNSAYDGAPIPREQMREWRDAAVRRIRDLEPRRVLEIGAGGGHIIAGLAPHCVSYHATDLSANAVDSLRRDLVDLPELAGKVEVRHQAAHDFSDLPSGFFDTVVLNSVVQYFPSADYLRRVLAGALELLAPGGTLFVGDVRDANLRSCLFTAAECATVPPTSRVSTVRLSAGQRTLVDDELSIAPEFFTSLGHPVDIRLKPGTYDNELSRYRYDVTIHKGQIGSRAVDARLRWGQDVRHLGELAALLGTATGATVRVCGIPEARLAGDIAVQQALAAAAADTTVGALDPRPRAGIRQDELEKIADNAGLQVLAVPGGTPGEFDAVFLPHGEDRTYNLYEPGEAPLGPLVHDPRVAAVVTALPGTLMTELRGTVPEHLLPSAIVLLADLPRTPNGKVDHAALPDPRPAGKSAGRAPRTVAEQHLCVLFAEVLGLPGVGIDDNFFDLGGHSLMAARLVKRIEATLDREIDTSALFVAPTVATLAERIGANEQRFAFDVLLPMREHGHKPPLFCVHPVGGLGWQYAVLMRQLGADHPIYALQARGLNDPGMSPSDIEEMAADYVEVIRAVRPNGPFHLLGWSFGGLVAHSMATTLRSAGEEVGMLAVMDSYVMADIPDVPPTEVFGSQSEVFSALLAFAGVRPAQPRVEDLTAERFLEILRQSDSLLSGFTDERLVGMASVFENNVRLAMRFRPARFDGDMLFFAARADDQDSPMRVSLWDPYVAGRLDVHHGRFLHADMGSPDSLAEVGRIVAARMRDPR